MKILVLEDDFTALKGAFDYLNVKYYGGTLLYEVYSKTQDLPDLQKANDFDRIFVDISLHRNSSQDGYSFIRSLKAIIPNLIDKVIVITGSDKVRNKLIEFELPSLRILSKPVSFLDLKSVMPA